MFDEDDTEGRQILLLGQHYIIEIKEYPSQDGVGITFSSTVVDEARGMALLRDDAIALGHALVALGAEGS